MIREGNASIHVKEMERAIESYADAVGLPLRKRVDHCWAESGGRYGLVLDPRPARLSKTLGAGIVRPTKAVQRLAEALNEVVSTRIHRSLAFKGSIQGCEKGALVPLLT